MGSGHFLVNAAYRVANEILEMVAENAWETDEDIIKADIQYWKRKVVENCIYGIDINGLSVALARLSLWLISASNDKALSFIDHHLKEGNSIIGTDRRHVEIKGSKDNLFGVLSYEDYMRPILEKYNDLKMVGSATKADVGRQKEIYEQINEDLKLAKKKYDYYLASQYAGGIEDQLAYFNLLSSKYLSDFEKEEMGPLWEIADEKKFFHWEIEFSEVFQKGGFDIAIGNPPYVDVSKVDYLYSLLLFPDTTNLYSYMIDNNLNFLKKESYYASYIIPLSLVCSDRMKPLRTHIRKCIEGNIKFINIDSSTHPGTLFKNLVLRLTIMIINKTADQDEKKLFSTNYIKFF